MELYEFLNATKTLAKDSDGSKITNKKIAANTGLSLSYINQMSIGEKIPAQDTFIRIMQYLCSKIQHLGFIEEDFMEAVALVYEETAFK